MQTKAQEPSRGAVWGAPVVLRLHARVSGAQLTASVLLSFLLSQKMASGTYLVAQWIRLHAPNAGGPGLIPGRGTGSHMLQLSPHAATKKSACHN